MADTGLLNKGQLAAAAAFALFFSAGCATVNVPNLGEEGYRIEDDERRLHRRSEELVEELDRGPAVYRDREMNRYLTSVAESLVPKELKSEGMTVSVRVIQDPSFNAFALPNGRVYVHTGLLAVIENEAQLAALLAHELTHVKNRHALKQFRSVTNKTAFLSSLYVPIAYAAGDLGAIFTELAAVSSIYGYSKNLENEADREGFEMLKEAGYDVREAPKLFGHLKDYIEAEDVKQPFFFSTHPRVVSRMRHFEQYVAETPEEERGTRRNSPRFQRFQHVWMLDNARLCFQAGMFRTAEKVLKRFNSVYREDGRGYYLLGELYRQRQDRRKKEKTRDKEKDYVRALEAYARAVSLDPRMAAAYRGMGRVYQKTGDGVKAGESFQRYLELQPDARDKGYIEQYIEESFEHETADR